MYRKIKRPAEVADGCLNLFCSLVNEALSPARRAQEGEQMDLCYEEDLQASRDAVGVASMFIQAQGAVTGLTGQHGRPGPIRVIAAMEG